MKIIEFPSIRIGWGFLLFLILMALAVGFFFIKPSITGYLVVELNETTVERSIICDGCSENFIAGGVDVGITLTAALSKTVENAILAEYYPGDWTLVDSGGGVVSVADENYYKIEWPVIASNTITVTYVVSAPADTTDFSFDAKIFENLVEENITEEMPVEEVVENVSKEKFVGKVSEEHIVPLGLHVKDSRRNKLNAQLMIKDKHGIAVSNLTAGEYEVDVILENHPVKEIKLRGVKIDENTTEFIGVDDVPEFGDYVEVYAIDPTKVNFTDATVTATAKGTELYKCKDWNFTEQICYGTWAKLMDITPGMNYTFTLTPEDPAYSETRQPSSADSYVNQGSAGTNYGIAATMTVQSRSASRNMRTFVMFNLSDIPSGAQIVSANLSLYKTGNTGSATRVYQVFRVTSGWNETGPVNITWNSQPSNASVQTSNISIATGTNNVWRTWDVTKDARGFINGTYTNYGWMIKDSVESSGTQYASIFASNNYANTTLRPRLSIFYIVDTYPNSTLNYPPINYYNDSSSSINLTFNCSAADDFKLVNLSLYITNSSNQSFALNSTAGVSGISNSTRWNLSLTNGNYSWNCYACDNASHCSWASANRTVNINYTCTPNLTNTSSTWYNITGCQINDTVLQQRNLTQYDSNYCPGSVNQTFYEYNYTTCNYCTSTWMNINTSCHTNDTFDITYIYANTCCADTGLPSDCNIPANTTGVCNYCSYNVTNSSWSAWQNQGICLINDSQLQNRSKTEYDSNYSTCYAVTGLSTDLWNSGNNNTYWEFNYTACDYCTPNWIAANTSCNASDNLTQYYTDANNCYAQTGLASDNNPPANQTFNCNYCTSTWTNVNSSCHVNDTFDITYTYTNTCCADTGLPSDCNIPSNTTGVCNYCTENITGPFNTTCNVSNKLTQYYIDTNYSTCCAVTGLVPDCGVIYNASYTNQTLDCTYCTSNLTNTSWSPWYNLTGCQINDTILQARNRMQHDTNNCVGNQTFYEYNYTTCNYCSYNVTNSSWSSWQNQGICLINDSQLQNKSKTEYDSNYSTCYAVTGLPSDLWNSGNNNTYWEFNYTTCDYCTPNWIAANTSCNTSDNLTQYYVDTNNCYTITGLASDNNPPANQTFGCNYCTSTWMNINTSCHTNDTFDITYIYANTCCADTGLPSDCNIPANTTGVCNYCSYNITNSSWSAWQNIGTCLIDDSQLQNRSRTEYDSNYSTCYTVTGLPSDLWNSGNNNTHWESQFVFCNYCTENITGPFNTTCNVSSELTQSYIDNNYAACCAITNLSSDCSIDTNPTYANQTLNCTYTPDEDGDNITDSLDNLVYNESSVISSGLTNLDISVNGTTNIDGNAWNGTFDIEFYDNGVLFLNFTHNFTANKINLSNVRIEKTSLGIAVNLSGQLAANETKTLYIDDSSFVTLCVKDAEISSVSAISADCTGANETDFTSCLGNSLGTTINNITCYDLGATIKVANLRYSGIKGTQAAAAPSAGGKAPKPVVIPIPEVIPEIPVTEPEEIRRITELDYIKGLDASALEESNLSLRLKNIGNVSIKNITFEFEKLPIVEKPFLIHTHRIFGWDFMNFMGWVTKSKVTDLNLLEWQFSEPKEYEVLNPGEELKVNLGITAPLTKATFVALKFRILSYGKVIYEEVLPVRINTTDFLVVTDVHEDDNLVDVYFIITNLKDEDKEFSVEFDINSKPDPSYKPTSSVAGLYTSVFNGPSTVSLEVYGPYKIKAKDTVMFAYQYRYDDKFADDYHLKYTLYEGDKKIRQAAGEFNLTK